MPQHIDYDRGVHKRTGPGGIEVYMYKDDPGVYLNAYGTPLPESIAEAAGFDVATNRKAKLKKERVAAALRAVDADLASLEGEPDAEEVVTKEQDGWKIIDIGLGRRLIKDPEGNQITPQSMPQEQAESLLAQLAGPPSTVPEKEAKQKPKANEKQGSSAA